MNYSVYKAAVGTLRNNIYILGGKVADENVINAIAVYNVNYGQFWEKNNYFNQNIFGSGSYFTQINYTLYIFTINRQYIYRFDLKTLQFASPLLINENMTTYNVLCLTSFRDAYLVLIGSQTNKIYVMDIESVTLYS